ncbi:MAG: SDR family oxidoreductase [Candidatus Omnitrophica bacterium]|nr:SDR family oxidoreductase [Candidatus Omnitrophota bacterium]
MNLLGKTVFITGAAKRLGRETALMFASRGAGVILHANQSWQDAENLKVKIKKTGGSAWTVRAEFNLRQGRVEKKIRDLARDLDRKCPPVDILVNNASIFYPTPLESLTEKDWDDFQTVNLKVPFFLAREFGLRMCRRRAGKIINLADWTAWRPDPRYLPYAISKAGLVSMTQGLAKALAPHVQVNGIAPGPILKAKGMTAAGEKAAAAKTLLGRFGSASDISEAVRYFCESADFVTGVCLPVDGGCSAA